MRLSSRRHAVITMIMALTIAVTSGTTPVTAAELTPEQLAGDTPRSVIAAGQTPGIEPEWREKLPNDDPRVTEMYATSPAMDNRQIPLVVIKAADANRPIIYLLNGADGGEARANWIIQTDAIDFYKEKNVNVVIPMAGKFSYYTDWVSDAPNLGGKQKWETWLTKELPAPMEAELKTNGKRAIAGMSMSATSAIAIAQHYPEFYDATAAFSGCYGVTQPTSAASVYVTLNRGHVTPEQMWGQWPGETWARNDALLNAEKLRGTGVYVSTGSGLAGLPDMPNGPQLQGTHPMAASLSAAITTTEGGGIEAVTNNCTHDFKVKLDRLGIPATFKMRNAGTHSWGYWREDLRESWPVLEAAFNS